MAAETELTINTENVCYIIDKARQFHAKEQVVLPDTPFGPGDISTLRILSDHADDPTYAEMKYAIEDLDPDQQVVLVALLWLGRGEYEAGDWEQALNDAREAWTPNTADYVIATPLAADYLQEGLALLGHGCEE